MTTGSEDQDPRTRTRPEIDAQTARREIRDGLKPCVSGAESWFSTPPLGRSRCRAASKEWQEDNSVGLCPTRLGARGVEVSEAVGFSDRTRCIGQLNRHLRPHERIRVARWWRTSAFTLHVHHNAPRGANLRPGARPMLRLRGFSK